MRSPEKEHAEEVVVVVVTAVPVRAALTFAIVSLFAPNEERSERIDEICAEVNVAALAIGANVSIDVANASPAVTAATFANVFVVNVVITIINYFSRT